MKNSWLELAADKSRLNRATARWHIAFFGLHARIQSKKTHFPHLAH